MDSELSQMYDMIIKFLDFFNVFFIGTLAPIVMFKLLAILKSIAYDCCSSDYEYENDVPDEYKTYLDEHIEVLIKKYDNME